MNDAHPLLDADAFERIDYFARRLRRRFPRLEADDLRQELILQLLRSSKRFDPQQATRKTFVDRVLRLAVRHLTRTALREYRPAPLEESLVDRPRDLDLMVEVGETIARLPPRLQRICRELASGGSSEEIEQIRAHFTWAKKL
jgi:DNA-directed RNA polymerase specialized sigma24 family protein